jgi:hypothetical protein
VAYEDGSGGEEFNSYFVVVRNLHTGRVIRKMPTGTPATPSKSLVGLGPTTAIVLKSDGAVAWIVNTGSEYQVHATDASGSRTLASGTDIGRESLALASNTIYWTENSTAMSAPLN